MHANLKYGAIVIMLRDRNSFYYFREEMTTRCYRLAIFSLTLHTMLLFIANSKRREENLQHLRKRKMKSQVKCEDSKAQQQLSYLLCPFHRLGEGR